ncbi:hypothetical protein GWI33_010029, partial [Rhynchophorus ferrugineus]
MPSKVLISTANRLYDARTIDQVGLSVKMDVDSTAVMSHVRHLRDRFTSATLRDVDSWKPEHKISGQAKFINQNTVAVNGQHYQAKSFIIAVGSTPNIIKEWKDILNDRFLTTDQIFELPQLPKSLAVIGSGVIAIELAQAFHRLGVETTIFARSNKVGILSSPKLQDMAHEELLRELNIRFETLPEQVSLENDQIKITYHNKQSQLETIFTDYLLSATGRSSLLSTLTLEKINPAYGDVKTLPIDLQTKQLGEYPIFIVGDAFSKTPLQHEAAHEGRATVQNCLNYPQVQNIKTLAPLGIVFCSPEMAIVGQTFQQLNDAKADFVTGFASYEKQSRALTLGKNQG